MFKKVLITNRGEVAVRIIRACRDLGIIPAVVYSETDRASLHVRLADEAYRLGPASAAESYLDIDKVIEAAKAAHADAIHPGHGFLSENPDFASACADAGIAWIGPSAESMRLMSNIDNFRNVLQQEGIPLAPGTFQPLTKENFIAWPRSIEIPVLADRYGNAIYLGEREILLGLSYQTFLAESPSPLLNETLRRQLGEMAIRIARIAQCENAGTVQFIMDADKHFYFLDIASSIAPEHALTEAVTGLDWVWEQLRIASGEPLTLRQDQVLAQGWALTSHIYIQDPKSSSGVIRGLQEPQGPGMRLDSGIYQGCEIPIDYYPPLAKLITFGVDRMQAIARMRRALREYRIEGIKTNLPLLVEMISGQDFMDGNTYVGLLEEVQIRSGKTPTPSYLFNAHALAAALAYADAAELFSQHADTVTESPWKLSGRPGFSKGSSR
jgi:acetyl-CoA carboxylase, biotin carboxylase subunit